MNYIKEEQKIPNNLKEHVQSYLNDLKAYMKASYILRRNKAVFVCDVCSQIYPIKHSATCDKCGSYMSMFSSKNVTISIPSRKEKYKYIKEENEKIKERNEVIQKENEIIEREKDNLIIKNFNELLKNINYNNSEEILGYLIKINQLDNYYKNIPDNKKYLLENVKNAKTQKIKNALNDKFSTMWKSDLKYDLFQSYIEELKYCKSRFPEYQRIFNTMIIKIENCLDDLKSNKFIYSSSTNLISLDEIDDLNGLDFEKFTYNLLKLLGYKDLELTKASGDFGVDVLATKDGVKYAIQCKNYKSSVGSESVQEAYSGKNYYNCHVGIVITNNYFTNHAKSLAKKNGILLWDREKLEELINQISDN